MTTTRTWLSGLLLLAGATVCGTGAAAQTAAPTTPAAPAQAADTSARGAAATDAAPRQESDRTRPRRSRRSSTRLEEAEIAELAVTYTNAYSLIAAVRAPWLRTRGMSSINRSEQVQVYRDGVHLGGVGSLRQVTSSSILSIEYLDGSQATARFGTDHGAGVIVIRSK